MVGILLLLLVLSSTSALHQENFADPLHGNYPKDVVSFLMRIRTPSRFRISPTLDRSSSVTIENYSPKTFHLVGSQCVSGGFSKAPPRELPANGTVQYAIASDTVFQSVECTIEYRTQDGNSYVYTDVENPVVGSNTANATTSVDLKVVTTVGPGMSNNVRFLVEPV